MKLKTYLLLLILIIFSTDQLQAQLLGSLYFNGSDNYVEVGNSPLNTIGTGDFTFEAWIQGNEADQNRHPILFSNRGSDAFGGGIMFFMHNQWNGSPSKMLCLQINAVNHLFINNGSFNGSILDGKCHHVAISRNGSELSFYIDGNKIGNKPIPNNATVSLNTPLLIGKDQATNNTFNGIISQCRIWDIARTQSEIALNKDVSLSGNESGLIAYWEMNNENNQVVTDKTGQFNGTLGSSNIPDSRDPSWSTEGCIDESGTPPGTPVANCAFQIAPNPTSGWVNIQQEFPPNAKLSVINSVGQFLATITLETPDFDIDLSPYPSGVYFLQLQFEGCITSKRVVKT